MIDFQDSAGHSNRLASGLTTHGLGGDAVLTMAAYFDIATVSAAGRLIMSIFPTGLTRLEFMLEAANPPHLVLMIGDGATQTALSTSTVDATLHNAMVCCDGVNADFYIDGAADGTPVMSKTPSVGSTELYLGNRDGGTVGFRGKLGQLAIWSDALGQAEATLFNAGATMPSLSTLVYWHRGRGVPGSAEYPKPALPGCTIENTVTFTSTVPPDEYFLPDGRKGEMYLLSCWMAPIIASGLFGAYLKMEPAEKLFPALMRAAGCWVEPLYASERAYLLEMLSVRPRYAI